MASLLLTTTPSQVTARSEDDPAIEGLRGLAALMVMATHFAHLLTPQAGVWGFASTGVDLFFVLSGYVFAPYLFGKPLPLFSHLVRRFFRLYPLYICALLLYVALHQPAASAWDYFGTHLVMGHTLKSLAVAGYYNGAFWSLVPEVEYYLILPFLAWAVARIRFMWLLLMAVAIHLMLVAGASPDEGTSLRVIATVHLPGLLVEFMLGSMAYGLVKFRPSATASRLRLASGLMILVGMCFVFFSFVASNTAVPQTPPAWIGGNIGLGAALGYALLVSGVVQSKSQSWAITQPHFYSILILLGQLSYGVYLFHNAAPMILQKILPTASPIGSLFFCVIITVLIAYIMHIVIEKPLRNYGRNLSRKLNK